MLWGRWWNYHAKLCPLTSVRTVKEYSVTLAWPRTLSHHIMKQYKHMQKNNRCLKTYTNTVNTISNDLLLILFGFSWCFPWIIWSPAFITGLFSNWNQWDTITCLSGQRLAWLLRIYHLLYNSFAVIVEFLSGSLIWNWHPMAQFFFFFSSAIFILEQKPTLDSKPMERPAINGGMKIMELILLPYQLASAYSATS